MNNLLLLIQNIKEIIKTFESEREKILIEEDNRIMDTNRLLNVENAIAAIKQEINQPITDNSNRNLLVELLEFIDMTLWDDNLYEREKTVNIDKKANEIRTRMAASQDRCQHVLTTYICTKDGEVCGNDKTKACYEEEKKDENIEDSEESTTLEVYWDGINKPIIKDITEKKDGN